jgi:hypothetical protein
MTPEEKIAVKLELESIIYEWVGLKRKKSLIRIIREHLSKVQ